MYFSRMHMLVAAAVFAMADGGLRADESSRGGQPAKSATATTPQSQTGPASIAPVPAMGLDAAEVPPATFSMENIGGMSVVHPGVGEPAAPGPASASQNRVLPSNADNIAAFSRETVYSPNWLVDGVRRLEAEEKRERLIEARLGRRAEALLSGDQSEKKDGDVDIDPALLASDLDASAAAAAAANDPLVRYLHKWLDTPGAANAAAGTHSATVSDYTAAAISTGAAPAQLHAAANPAAANQQSPQSPRAQRMLDSVSVASQLVQPVLESAGPSIVLPPPPIPPETMTAPPAADQSGAPMTGIPDNKKLQLKPIAPQIDLNKPLVNDKKYFPQLQRF